MTPNIVGPFVGGLKKIAESAGNRHPHESLALALLESPHLGAAFVGLSLAFSQACGVQVVLEAVEISAREACRLLSGRK